MAAFHDLRSMPIQLTSSISEGSLKAHSQFILKQAPKVLESRTYLKPQAGPSKILQTKMSSQVI